MEIMPASKIQLNSDVLECVLRHLPAKSKATTLRQSSLVCRTWRTVAQKLLFIDICLKDRGSDDGRLANVNPALRQRLHLAHRSMTSCPNLAQYLEHLSYQVPPGYDTFDLFRQIMEGSPNLAKLTLYPDGPRPAHVVLEEASRYSDLFQQVTFTHLTIKTRYLDRVAFVPARRLIMFKIIPTCRASAPDSPPLADLSNIRINADEIVIQTFGEAQHRGIGSTFWLLSAMLSSCAQAPRTLALLDVPISLNSLTTMLASFGNTLEHLWIEPPLCSDAEIIVDLSNLGRADVDWSYLVPNLSRLTSNIVIPSFHYLSNVQSFNLVVTRRPWFRDRFESLLAAPSFKKNLRQIRLRNWPYSLRSESYISAFTSHQLDILEAFCSAEDVKLYPTGYISDMRKVIQALALIRSMNDTEVFPEPRDSEIEEDFNRNALHMTRRGGGHLPAGDWGDAAEDQWAQAAEWGAKTDWEAA
jgi:hypothetical protein